jgi:hypothetical protein
MSTSTSTSFKGIKEELGTGGTLVILEAMLDQAGPPPPT